MYEILEKIMSECNMTPYRLAKQAGISQSSLSDWKHGKGKPKHETLVKIAKVLNVSPEYLITGDESKRSPMWQFMRENVKPPADGDDQPVKINPTAEESMKKAFLLLTKTDKEILNLGGPSALAEFTFLSEEDQAEALKDIQKFVEFTLAKYKKDAPPDNH